MLVNRRPRAGLIVSVVASIAALSQWGPAAVIYTKAWLAPQLIEHAYNAANIQQVPVKPWPWADHYPVAKLTARQQGLERWVLSNDSGNALAFGPGMAAGPHPDEPGITMISGHRDTHFRFLQETKIGDDFTVHYEGSDYSYRVSDTLIVDARDGLVSSALPEQGLLLVTCYPFDSIVPGGPLRFVVVATAIER